MSKAVSAAPGSRNPAGVLAAATVDLCLHRQDVAEVELKSADKWAGVGCVEIDIGVGYRQEAARPATPWFPQHFILPVSGDAGSMATAWECVNREAISGCDGYA
jgi:hypothetical protein